MLRIGIDATPLMRQPTGVGLFVRYLIDELQHHRLELKPFAVSRRAKNELRPLLPEGMIGFSSPFPAPLVHRMWPRFEFPKIEGWTGPIDVAHGTNYVIGPTKAASIVTVHDLTVLRHPEWVQSASLRFPELIRRAIGRGATLQCFTDLVADQIAEDFHLSTDRIAVIQPGIIPVPEADANSARQQLGTGRYVLAIGTVEPRKNLANLLRAFDLVTERDSETTLVVVGADGWGTEEFNRTQEQMRYPERVRRIGYVEKPSPRRITPRGRRTRLPVVVRRVRASAPRSHVGRGAGRSFLGGTYARSARGRCGVCRAG
jgi:glycosyltransferase involved in cell wall biosynthesis